MLITDGSQTKTQDALNPGIMAADIRKAGIKTLVIGITNPINSDELRNIDGSEDK